MPFFCLQQPTVPVGRETARRGKGELVRHRQGHDPAAVFIIICSVCLIISTICIAFIAACAYLHTFQFYPC